MQNLSFIYGNLTANRTCHKLRPILLRRRTEKGFIRTNEKDTHFVCAHFGLLILSQIWYFRLDRQHLIYLKSSIVIMWYHCYYCYCYDYYNIFCWRIVNVNFPLWLYLLQLLCIFILMCLWMACVIIHIYIYIYQCPDAKLLADSWMNREKQVKRKGGVT